jgi:hypothetical protein
MATLKEQIREAARLAEQECVGEEFDAMSWLDSMLEDNPEIFDPLFEQSWAELSEEERADRMRAIRRVL